MATMTPASLIDALGGSAEVAKKIGRPVGTVAAWKHRDAIPSEAWPAFISLAAEREQDGVTAAALLEMHHGHASEQGAAA